MVMIVLCGHQHHCAEFVCASSLQFDSSREMINPSVTLKGGHEYKIKVFLLEEVNMFLMSVGSQLNVNVETSLCAMLH